jgi:hypothetical protein
VLTELRGVEADEPNALSQRFDGVAIDHVDAGGHHRIGRCDTDARSHDNCGDKGSDHLSPAGVETASFDGVEGDDPQRIPVLPRNHVVDDRTEIGFNEVCLSKRAAELTKVLNDDVGRDVIFGVQWGMINNSHWASRRGVVRTPDRQSESIVQGDAASAACREGGSGIKPDAASVAIERLIDAGP